MSCQMRGANEFISLFIDHFEDVMEMNFFTKVQTCIFIH